MDAGIITTAIVCVTFVAVTYLIYRYYVVKFNHQQQVERIKQDNALLADGGENEEES